MGQNPAKNVIPLSRRGKNAHRVVRGKVSAELGSRLTALERHVYGLDRRLVEIRLDMRFQAALAASILLHLVIVLFVTVKLPEKPPGNANQSLDVVMVNAKSKNKPLKADALAQHNLDGGGNTDKALRAKSPLPVPQTDDKMNDITLAQRRVQQLEQEMRKMIVRPKVDARVKTAPAQPAEQTPTTAPVTPDAADIVQRRLSIAQLQARISKDLIAYQERPRRKFIGARAREYRFARYVEDWRIKVERVGEVNYPQSARERKIYGSLVVTVNIKSDGSVERVELSRSSGHKILDNAARRIIKLAAPYAQFPPNIAKDTDIISITRTMTFTRTDRVHTE
jgi:periplasmic protein TonB